jgi:N-methylhydantoinase B
MSAMARDIDPITLEVVKNALSSLGDEMALVIMRSAYSPVVRDSMDYSTALCDRHGQIVAQGLTLAVQLGAFPEIMGHITAEYADDTHPGDIFIANDPYGAGGQHLPDIYVIKPIFLGASLEGYAATMAHHSDVGGIAAGSVAMHATEIYQEGLRLPLLKLYEGGKPVRALFEMIEKNTRNPIHVMGDLRAQLSACDVGEKGLQRLIDKYGAALLHPYFEELQDQAERMMMAEIEAIPDGEYSYTDYIDGFGEHPEPLQIAVTLGIKGSNITVDFTGTSAQVQAAINCPVAMAKSCAYCAIRCIGGQEIPNCQGYMRAVTVIAPEGTILNPLLPAACAARGVMGYRVFDAIMGALAQVVPDKVIAAGEGGPTLFSIGGYRNGEAFTLTEVMVGTWGARAARDGIEGISNPAANLSNQPTELIEAEFPLQVVRYGLVPDSGGAGRCRGGLAFVREFKLLSGEAGYTVRADRRDHPPYGLKGGRAGAPSRNVLNHDGVERELPTMPMESLPMTAGDAFCHVSAGGGGFGKPLERYPERVLADVIDQKVSIEAARGSYGVVVDSTTRTIDKAATKALRAEMARTSRQG